MIYGPIMKTRAMWKSIKEPFHISNNIIFTCLAPVLWPTERVLANIEEKRQHCGHSLSPIATRHLTQKKKTEQGRISNNDLIIITNVEKNIV